GQPVRGQAVIVLNTIRIQVLQGRIRRPGYTAGVPSFPVPPLPAVIDLSLVAVALGSLLILRLAHGALPWGHLMIAVGPDGRPMRPRVKWHLWSISRGEPPRLAAIGGFASVALGCAAAMRLWAESFRVDRATFERLSPGDRISIEYSARLRYVYHMVLPEPLKKAVG